MSAFSFLLSSQPGRVTRRFVDYPARPIDQICKPKSEVKDYLIPAKVIQTWEINSFGRRHRKELLRFRDLNPEFEFTLFTRVERDDFMRTFENSEIADIYFSSQFKPMQVDIFRYSYLYQNGGFYFDISMAVNRPLAQFLTPEATALLTQEKNNSIFAPPRDAFPKIADPLKLFAIWGFGFSSGHRILELALNRILTQSKSFRGRIFENPKTAIIAFTGPALFTASVWDYLSEENDSNISQLVNDFIGQGYRLKGAGYRHLDFPTYANARNQHLI
jgi:mannosyltransferase OCH1-like enzyme